MPGFHGWYVALWCGVPALLVLVLWLVLEGNVLDALLLIHFGPNIGGLDADVIDLLVSDVRNLAAGDAVGRDLTGRHPNRGDLIQVGVGSL